MRGGGKAFFITASLVTGACAASTGGFQVRAIPDPAARLRQGGGSLAEARGQLALGSPGLALEAFRKVLRAQGDSPDAYAGIAACYSAMGRYDLARSNYEAALALSPHDTRLLLALAPMLELLGENVEAAEARAEASRIASAPAFNSVAPPIVANAARSIDPTLPHQSPAKTVAETSRASPVAKQVRLPAVHSIAPSSIITVTLPPAATPRTVAAPAQAKGPTYFTVVAPDSRVTSLSSTITVELPPARPVGKLRTLHSSITSKHSPVSLRAKGGNVVMRTASSNAARTGVPSPRLERLSSGEVALVTTNAPMWRTQLISRTRLSTIVRWVPIQKVGVGPNIRLLNAARSAGLAARSRGMLLDRGWRKIEIGDAQQSRATSLVIYPASRRVLAQSLAAQFGCRFLEVADGNVLVVLLGRDATLRNALRG